MKCKVDIGKVLMRRMVGWGGGECRGAYGRNVNADKIQDIRFGLL